MSALNELIELSPEKLEQIRLTAPAAYQQLIDRIEEYEVARAREDYQAFCRYVLRDEQTDEPLRWAPYHSDYLDFIHKSEAGVVIAHVEMGKTQLGIGYLLWRLGKNPNLRILLLNAKATISQRTAATMRMHIDHNPRLKKVFPHLRAGTPWTDEEFCVERRAGITTSTVVASGVDSSIISFRFDLIWGDDIVNNENTQTAYLRAKTLTWFQNSPLSRTSRDMQVFITVNRWHPQDAAHMLSKLPGWRTRVYPVGKKLPDGSIKSYWPAQWPESRIKKELAKRTPHEGDRALFCIAYTDSTSRVQQQWFVNALQRGRGLGGEFISNMTEGIKLRPGEIGVVGVDLGLSDSDRADETAISFLGVKAPEGGFEIHDYEEVAKTGLLRGPEVTVYGMLAGRMLIDEVFETVIRANYAFNRAPIIFVESVQAQRWLVDIISKSHPHIQIMSFLTRGRGTRANKHHKVFGVEGWFRALAHGEVTFLCAGDGSMSPDTAKLIDDCQQYSPDTHTGDRLMSVWIAYQGSLAYMLENQIGEAGVGALEEAYGEQELDNLTIEEEVTRKLELHQRDFAENTRLAVWNVAQQALLEHQTRGVDVTGVGIFD